jgi:hypothetical protein
MNVKQAAEQIKSNLIERYGYFTDSEPMIDVRQTLHGSSEPTHALVIWECGPPEWATGDTYWLHEEVAHMLIEFGADPSYDPDQYKPYFDEIAGFYFEPVNSFTLAVFAN